MNEKTIFIYILGVLLAVSLIWNGVQYFTNRRLEDQMGQYILDAGRSREREQQYEEFYRKSTDIVGQLSDSLSRQSDGIQHLREQLLEIRAITEELENSYNDFRRTIDSSTRNDNTNSD